MRNEGIGSWPFRRARTAPHNKAIIFEGAVYTFGDVQSRSTRLAHALRALGVAKGDRVAYLGPNHPSIAEALFATGILGAILLPLNTRLAPPEHEFILRDAEPKVFIWSPDCAQSIEALQPFATSQQLVVLGDAQGASLGYEALLAAASEERIDDPVSTDDLCMIQYTSGTSGTPKGVMLTHGNVMWSCLNLLIDADIQTDEMNLVVAPMFHTAGMNNSFLAPFMKGGTAILMAKWDAEQALALIERHQITCMVAVPTIFETMTQSPRWADADVSSMRTLLCGASPLPATLIQHYAARGLSFQQGYGLTETSPNATILRPDAVEKSGSVGTSCFFSDLRIVAPDGTDVPQGTKGEVLTHGPNVTPGYWNKPQATADAFVDGDWLLTGDAALFDADGHVFIVDRIKDMIISGGENIYPAEVEAALKKHPAVQECAVIGIADARWGEVGRAVVLLKQGQPADESDFREFLTGLLASYKIPKSFVITDHLPRTATGKLMRRQVRDTHGQATNERQS